MFLVRKMNRAKWEKKEGLAEKEIPADAATNDLRTADNALSFWRCEDGGEQALLHTVLALVAAYERLDKIDIVWLSEEAFQEDGLGLRQTDGRTPVKSLVECHVDVHRLDYERLGRVARRVVESIEAGRFRRPTRARVRDVLAQAIDAGWVDPKDLKEKLRKEVVPGSGSG